MTVVPPKKILCNDKWRMSDVVCVCVCVRTTYCLCVCILSLTVAAINLNANELSQLDR